MIKTFTNPIIPGFSPDASVLRVDDDYYLTTSTFEWWPGIEIYHSKDLVNWEVIDNPLTRITQADLRGNYNSGSIWAPHLSYAENKFWLIYTNVKTTGTYKDTLNYVITTDNIGGRWSEPTFVNASGFDPCLFHDDDGKSYIINMLFDHRLNEASFEGLVIQRFNLQSRQLVGERAKFYQGTSLGVCEGPQMIKKDGWYYLLCAAGGTGYSHAATVARSRNLLGPYETSPYQPLLSTKNIATSELQKAGHASFVKVTDNEWYIVHISARPIRTLSEQRGNCPLGRETSMQKLVWQSGWPRLANLTAIPDVHVEVPSIARHIQQLQDYSERIEFSKLTKISQMPKSMKSLRMPLDRQMSLTAHPGFLRLIGRESITSLHEQSLLARRWQSLDFRVETAFEFNPKNFQQIAGLVLFYDTDNYQYLQMSHDDRGHCNNLQIEEAKVGVHRYISEQVDLKNGINEIKLAVNVTAGQSQFEYSIENQWHQIGKQNSSEYMSDDYIKNHGKLAFTGAMVGICVQDLDQHHAHADFKYFDYQEIHK